MTERRRAIQVLALNTLAFTVCFAVWMMNGVLITFLVGNRVFDFDKAEMGWLIGIPVLTGSIFRLPVGVLTDKYGGRVVYAVVMLLSAAACFLASYADSFWGFVLAGLGFGIAGTSFAVGIAYTSVWFPSHQQGTALGIFGAGNAGAALTSMGAPVLLGWLTAAEPTSTVGGNLPRLYAAALVVMTVVFWFFTFSKQVEHGHELTLRERLAPLKVVQVWRFGLYYFLVFGGFVALAQWLIPYYVNVYTVSVGHGRAACFHLHPAVRASSALSADGCRISSERAPSCTGCSGDAALASFLLIVPRMDIYAPGEGIMAASPGVVTEVTPEAVVIGEARYPLRPEPAVENFDERALVLPEISLLARSRRRARTAGGAARARRARGHPHLLPGEHLDLHRPRLRRRHFDGHR